MPHVSKERVRVRSYELDSYGHVNNAVFLQWLEHARCRFLQDRGLDYHEVERRWGVRFVLVSTRIDFRAQLSLDDTVELGTRVKGFGRTSVTFDQRILRLEAPDRETAAAESESTMVFTDPGMKGTRPIPEEFRRLYA